MNIIVNSTIGCKYPATYGTTLVRSMATVIRGAANNYAGRQQFTKRLTVNLDPNEGSARPWVQS